MKYLEKVREMERHFKGYSGQHIPRDDNNEADKLAKAAARNQEMPPDVFFEIINGELYKSRVTEPWLRCITSEKGLELLKEIHSGFCGAHIGTRALAGKAIKQGFYWPTINIDAKAPVRQCEACQKMINPQNLTSITVHLIPPSWPLQRWGMDLVTTTNSSRKLLIHSCRCGVDG
jgi:hypothetical protein